MMNSGFDYLAISSADKQKERELLTSTKTTATVCKIYKLETDPDILLQKADAALQRYRMHVVVANLLANYKEEVMIVTHNEETKVRCTSKDEDLEEQLIGHLTKTH